MNSRRLLAVFAVLTLAACDSIDRAPTGLATDQEPSDSVDAPRLDPSVGRERSHEGRILRHASGVSMSQGAVRMWAVRGQSRRVRLQYGDGGAFATFAVGANTLVSDAAGNPVAFGDSVQITMQVLNPSTFAVEMQPAGIRFNPEAPATLEFNLERAMRKSLRNRGLSFQKRESASSPWESVSALIDYDRRVARASIPGFTIYAIFD
jgi:hypothetical protein